jgi:type IX secretion system substrate protein/parallel beta helix pectate lyase-like protein
MKKILTTVILIIVISFAVNGQTTVSGGIYTNTTWTLANSPYTADTVVVFPNVTLTIEPGVVVIVNGNLEIRQSSLIAEGTITDSITFLGSLPILGDTLSNITLRFYQVHTSRINYCNFKANPDRGMDVYAGDSLTIKNSYFTDNGTGILFAAPANVDSCVFKNNSVAIFQANGTISNSIFRANQNGFTFAHGAAIRNCIIDSNAFVGIESTQFDTITNCQIKNNGTGIKCNTNFNGYGSQIHNNIIENNSIGIQLSDYGTTDSIYCNKICNNTTYNLKMTTPFNRIAANNYWCSNDSLTIANSIWDGYDNASLGLVNFMPIDTLQCYSVTGISIYELQSVSFSIYPNPASNYLTVESPLISKANIKIFNMLGGLEYSSEITKRKVIIDISTLFNGAYIIQISNGESISRQKLIRH